MIGALLLMLASAQVPPSPAELAAYIGLHAAIGRDAARLAG
jgi:hypothetical protein